MKVKLITTYAGPKGTFFAGTTIDVSEKEANDLVGGGYAKRVVIVSPVPTAEDAIETATVDVPEKAVTRGKGRRR